MRVLAIINPGSGTAEPGLVEAEIRRRHADAVVHHLRGRDDPAAVVRAIADPPLDLVIASGGDGTIGSVASAIQGTRTQIGIVPTGTANVLAHELRIPLDVAAACDVIAEGVALPIDVMALPDRISLCRVAFGLIGEIGQETTPAAKQRLHALAYVWNALPRVFNSPGMRFDMEIDGRAMTTVASCLIVTNVGLVGWGEMRWGPTVLANDGRIDVLAIHTQTMSENLRIVWDAVSGDVVGSCDVSHFRAERSVRVKTSPDVAIVADGEPVVAPDLEILVRPRSLAVRVPRPQLESGSAGV